MDIRRLEEIQREIRDLADEALEIVKEHSEIEYERARSYWYPHILGAIDKDNSGYLGGSMIGLAETIENLKEAE